MGPPVADTSELIRCISGACSLRNFGSTVRNCRITGARCWDALSVGSPVADECSAEKCVFLQVERAVLKEFLLSVKSQSSSGLTELLKTFVLNAWIVTLLNNLKPFLRLNQVLTCIIHFLVSYDIVLFLNN